jgi:NAD(P)H-flavin reductase
MIDCDIKFGAFLPTVPQIYQDAASESTDFEKNIREASDCFIGPTWTSLKLTSIEQHNHDTSIFEFELPDSNAYLQLPITAHLLVKAPSNGRSDDSRDDVNVHVRPYTALEEIHAGRFKIMVKLYTEWGIPESEQKENNQTFLYTKTDHSYKPPGKVSNYIHSLSVGQTLSFKHTDICLGKINYPFDKKITSITMIAVGAGVAPMIRICKALLHDEIGNDQCHHVKKIRLLYGTRTVADILQRKQLDEWHERHNDRFQVCYCIGSRWSNVHFAAKTTQKDGPPLPHGWETISPDRKELGWVNGDTVSRRGASNAQDDGHRVFICGLPGVYLSLCGRRSDPSIEEGTQLHRLGYQDHQVVKF